MSRRGTPVNPQIKCPWCGATYPNIRRNGYYMRDKFEIPQYYCKRCKKGFSGSVIKIKVLKPPYEVEIGYLVKVEVKIRVERELQTKKVKCRVLKDKREIAQIKLKKEKDFYKGIWNIKEVEEGKYILEVTFMGPKGYGAIQTKVVKVVQRYDVLIRKIAAEHGVDPFLVKGLIWKESSFNLEVISNKGAKGLMQLMPETANEVGVRDVFDPEQNIRGGLKYFNKLLNKFGSVRLALGAYNWGPGNVITKARRQESRFPKSVREYIDRVLELGELCRRRHSEYYEEE